MWKTKLCLGVTDADLPVDEQMEHIAKAGFEGVFTGFDGTDAVLRNKKLADKLGLVYQSVHAPFDNIGKIWRPGIDGQQMADTLKECICACAQNGVPVMVSHVFIGFHKPAPTEQSLRLGLQTLEGVVLEAQKQGVTVAFENTEGEEYLAAVMSHFKDCPAVGFCWDSGHELCYNHGRDMLALYGDRLAATHLNDNLGIRDFGGDITYHDDLHLLPFDGISDWKYNVSRLNKTGFSGMLTFELGLGSKPDRHENDAYGEMAYDRYLGHAYMRACRVAALKNAI